MACLSSVNKARSKCVTAGRQQDPQLPGHAHNADGEDPGGVKATVAFTIIDREQNKTPLVNDTCIVGQRRYADGLGYFDGDFLIQFAGFVDGVKQAHDNDTLRQ